MWFYGFLLTNLALSVLCQPQPSPIDGGGTFQFTDYAQCYVDPSDNRYLEVPFTWFTGGTQCSAESTLGYTDSNDVSQTGYGLNDPSPPIDSDIDGVFRFYIPLTSFINGGVVHETAIIYNANSEQIVTASYTLFQSPTIITTASTTTTTTTTVILVGAPTITVGIITTTTTLTATPTTTVTDTMGTDTVVAQRQSSTVTITTTPNPYTKVTKSFKYTTVTPTCIPRPGQKNLQPREGDDVLEEPFAWHNILKRGFTGLPASSYATPSCGSYNPATVYSTTVTSTVTTTTTPPITVAATTTATVTTTGTTSTVHESAQFTITTTPQPYTSTITKTANRRVKLSTSTMTLTKTVYTKNSHLCPTLKKGLH